MNSAYYNPSLIKELGKPSGPTISVSPDYEIIDGRARTCTGHRTSVRWTVSIHRGSCLAKIRRDHE